MGYKLAVIVLLGCLCVKIHGGVPNLEMLAESMPGYAVTTAIELLNSTQCRKEMTEFRNAVERGAFWSLRMLDASGQPSSGFIDGNNFWTGNRDQCTFLSEKWTFAVKKERVMNMPLYRFGDDDFPPFQLNFFGAQMLHKSNMQYHVALPVEEVLVLGICLPASCTEQEVSTMLRKVFDEKVLLATRLYSMDVEFLKISDLKDDYTWMLSGRMIMVFFILVSVVSVVIAGTVCDARIQQKQLQKKIKLLIKGDNNIETNGDVTAQGEHVQNYSTTSQMRVNRTEQILLCFSIYSNVKPIFDLNVGPADIRSFHGLRIFGMIWIIMFHIIHYATNATANTVDGFLRSSDIFGQILYNAFLSVDTFFVLSGFLLAHAHLKKQTRAKQTSFYDHVSDLVNGIFKRYIRITPAFLITMLLVIVVFTWSEQFSLLYFSHPMHDTCWKYWWRNLLFINNFYDWHDMCLNWSWYLSNDMQFYIFGSIILILSTSYYYISIGLCLLTVIASTVVHAYVAYSISFAPTMDMFFETLNQLYIKPHMRIPPFIVGMGTALLLNKWNNKLELSKKDLTTCWSVAILFLGIALFGLSDRNMPLSIAVLYESCSRLFWSLGIAWIVIACITGNGGIVNTILSLPCWIPLSRLTYCAYLLNPVVIVALAMSMKQPFYSDIPTLVTISAGVTTLVYVISIVLSVCVEQPMTTIVKLSTVNKKRV